MRIHFSDIRRAKRLARALQRELNKLGTDIGLTAAQDLAARLYGYESFHELKACIGKRPASEWDEKCPSALVEARRAYQVDALVRAGIGRTTAETVIALIRPTGMREMDGKSPSVLAPKGTAVAATADLDALLEEIEGQIDMTGVSAEVAAHIDGAMLRAYLSGYDCVYLEAYGDNYSMYSRRFGDDQRLRGGSRPHFDEIVRYLARKAWLDPSATGQSKGHFTFRHAGSDIDVKLTLDLGERFSTVEVEFATPMRRLPTMDLFSIGNSQGWLGTFKGTGGLHLVCAKNGSMPLLEALTRKLADDGHQVWGLRSRLEFVVPARKDGKVPNVAMVKPDHPGEAMGKTIESIREGSHVLWVIDASTLQEALLLLRGVGYEKAMIKEHLRSVMLPVNHDLGSPDTCYNWEASVFPVAGSVRNALALGPSDVLVGKIADGASVEIAREAALAGHREWIPANDKVAGQFLS